MSLVHVLSKSVLRIRVDIRRIRTRANEKKTDRDRPDGF